MVQLKCFCGTIYEAREADIKRGWAKTCSKSCAATKREFGKSNATLPDGEKVEFGKKYKRKNKPKRSRANQIKRDRIRAESLRGKLDNGQISYEYFLLASKEEHLTEDERLDKIDEEYYASLHPFSSEALGQY